MHVFLSIFMFKINLSVSCPIVDILFGIFTQSCHVCQVVYQMSQIKLLACLYMIQYYVFSYLKSVYSVLLSKSEAVKKKRVYSNTCRSFYHFNFLNDIQCIITDTENFQVTLELEAVKAEDGMHGKSNNNTAALYIVFILECSSSSYNVFPPQNNNRCIDRNTIFTTILTICNRCGMTRVCNVDYGYLRQRLCVFIGSLRKSLVLEMPRQLKSF